MLSAFEPTAEDIRWIGILSRRAGQNLTDCQVRFAAAKGFANHEYWHWFRCEKVACCGSRRTRFGPR
jgi:hypothetical protein